MMAIGDWRWTTEQEGERTSECSNGLEGSVVVVVDTLWESERTIDDGQCGSMYLYICMYVLTT